LDFVEDDEPIQPLLLLLLRSLNLWTIHVQRLLWLSHLTPETNPTTHCLLVPTIWEEAALLQALTIDGLLLQHRLLLVAPDQSLRGL
jgi:hypothetical protein